MSGYLGGVIVILSLNVILAYAIFLPVASGQLNLGGAAFQAVGAYTAGLLSTSYDLPVGPSLALSVVAGGVVALFFSLIILRTKSVYLVLATFAFSEFVSGVIVNVDALGGSMGLSVSAHISGDIVLLSAVAAAALVLLFMQTRLGLAIRAIHDDDLVSELMGIGVRWARVIAFTLGGLLAGLAGGLYAFYFNFVDIQSFDAASSIYLLLFVLLGGTQTVWGPLVGAAFFTIVPELLRSAISAAPELAHALGVHGELDSSWRFIILGALTVAMMVVRPEGAVTRVGLSRVRAMLLPQLLRKRSV